MLEGGSGRPCRAFTSRTARLLQVSLSFGKGQSGLDTTGTVKLLCTVTSASATYHTVKDVLNLNNIVFTIKKSQIMFCIQFAYYHVKLLTPATLAITRFTYLQLISLTSGSYHLVMSPTTLARVLTTSLSSVKVLNPEEF